MPGMFPVNSLRSTCVLSGLSKHLLGYLGLSHMWPTLEPTESHAEVTSEQRPKGGKGVSPMDLRKKVQENRIASAKVLRLPCLAQISPWFASFHSDLCSNTPFQEAFPDCSIQSKTVLQPPNHSISLYFSLCTYCTPSNQTIFCLLHENITSGAELFLYNLFTDAPLCLK